MAKYLDHITTEGERWDQLAQRYYGSAYAYPVLVEANSRFAHLHTLISGLLLKIPVIDRPATPKKLPPWRR